MKKLFALLIPALLTTLLSTHSALALARINISQSVAFGTCTVEIRIVRASDIAFVALQTPSSQIYYSGSSLWALTATTSNSITTSQLSECVSGSSASEFAITYNNGAEASSSFYNDEGMGLIFSFRGATYTYTLIGRTNTQLSATPDTISFPPATDPKKEAKKLISNVVSHNSRMILGNQPKWNRRLNRFKAGRLPDTGHLSAFGVSISNSGLPFEAKLNRDSGSFFFSLNQARQSRTMDPGKAKVSVDPFAIVGAVSPETRLDFAHNTSFKAPASETQASHAMGYVPPSSQPVGNPQPASDFVEPLKYDAWIEASFGQQNLGDSKTKFAILHAGMDYLVTSNLLLGFGAQMDWADYDSTSSKAKAEGFGFLIGPYMTSKLSDHLYLDARLGWGQSYSDVSPLGTYKDDVTTNRILASFAVIGDFDWHMINITPQVRLSYFRDESDAYVDSQGSSIEANHLETGILKFGPAFSKTFHLANGLTLTPKLSADGVWTFADNSSNSGVTSASGTGIRARLGAGLNIRTEDHLTLLFNALYDGIGQSDYEAYSGTIRLSKQW